MRRASMLFAAAFVAVAITAGSALAAGPVGKTTLVAGGSATLAKANGKDSGTGSIGTEVPIVAVDEDVPNTGNSAARVPSAGVPRPTGTAVVGTGSELVKGFEGLNHFDERTAGTGTYANTNFSLEPPDQALCVGGGQVIEGVNTAFVVYNRDGSAASAVTNYNQFFGLTPAIDRANGFVRGA